MSGLSIVLAGAIAAGEAVIGLFFLRFWARTRDRLFLAFAVAFWLMAVNQGLIGLYGTNAETAAPFYLLRLAAFVLIIFAIVRKNTESAGR